MAENPVGVDSLERANVKEQAIKAKASWEKRFRDPRSRYSQDPEIQALLPKPEVKKETKQEAQENGQKSKRRTK